MMPMMIRAFVDLWKRGLDLEGRTGRREFWLALAMVLIQFLLLCLPAFWNLYLLILPGVFVLAAAVPIYVMLVRRIHDIGWSGWWILLAILPAVGEIILLFMALIAGTPGANRYGPVPGSGTSRGEEAAQSEEEAAQK